MHWIRVESKFCTEKVTRFLIFYGLFVLNLWVPISFVVTLCWTLIFSGFLWNSGKFNNFSFPYQKFQSLHVASGHLHLFWLFPLPLISVTKTTAHPLLTPLLLFTEPFYNRRDNFLLLGLHPRCICSKTRCTTAVACLKYILKKKSDTALALARQHVSCSHITFELHVTGRRRCGPSVPGALEKDAKSLM